MSESNNPQLFKPPNLLGLKMGAQPGRSGKKLDPNLLAAAESAIERFRDDFPGVLMREVKRMTDDFDAYLREPAAGADSLTALRAAAFDLKGQGGSVGFAIVSRISDTLGRMLEGRDELGAREGEIVRAHIEALRAIAINRCAGDGGVVGQQITKALDLLTAKAAE